MARDRAHTQANRMSSVEISPAPFFSKKVTVGVVRTPRAIRKLMARTTISCLAVDVVLVQQQQRRSASGHGEASDDHQDGDGEL